jgi:chemotaxis protein histidine kinase CheA
LKAVASMQEMRALTSIAHEFENLLHSIRIGAVKLNDEVLRIFEETVDSLFEALSEAHESAEQQPTVLERLQRLAAPPANCRRVEEEIILAALPAETRQSLNDHERYKLQAAIAEGANLYLISTNFEVADFDAKFQSLKDKLLLSGELVSTAPTIATEESGKIDFRILHTRHGNLQEVENDLAGFSGVLAKELFTTDRMTSVEPVLEFALRAGRIAARSSGKEIDFKIEGQELYLDRTICDVIADPLIHLVRNAVDHGIETPAERTKMGKANPGTVQVKAAISQGQTRITVVDDGRGIDPVLISEAAARLGLPDAEVVSNLDQSVRMIFRPGFSTAETVSEISGRGVGLDVVERAVETLGGEIRVNSKPGLGSSFEMWFPVRP